MEVEHAGWLVELAWGGLGAELEDLERNVALVEEGAEGEGSRAAACDGDFGVAVGRHIF